MASIMKMLFKNKKVIGVDIGSSSIKFAELEMKKNGAKLVNFGFIPTPQNSILGGEIIDVDRLSESIRNLKQRIETKRENVVTGMWGTSVIVKKISIPAIDSTLIKDQVKWEAEQYIPLDINEVNLQYHILNQGKSSGEGIDILLVAAKQDFVFRYVEIMVSAGLNTHIVDVSSFALANCFELNYGRKKGEAVGLLNIGSTVTNLVVVENGEVLFCRDLPVGGGAYTTVIQKDLGVDLEEAEALKISATSRQEVPQEVHNIIINTNELVADEIQGGLDFFTAGSSESSITKLYYTGGSIVIPGLIEQIGENLKIPTEKMDPFRRIDFDKQKFSFDQIEKIKNFSPVALGLAMRELE